MSLKERYGKTALVAGGSEGLGAAFARYLAQQGLDLVLVARRLNKLEAIAEEIRAAHGVEVTCISGDLATPDATATIQQALAGKTIDVLVYNAALSFIGRFEENSRAHHQQIGQANMLTPMDMAQVFGTEMLLRKRGAVILMSSLTGFQGSGFLAAYAASKAFNLILAESLWYEWKDRGVDVIGCCAGATATPNFIQTNPEKTSFFAPKVQTPEAVVQECFKQLGKKPSITTGMGNKVATFFMRRVLPRSLAIKIIGGATRQMYRL